MCGRVLCLELSSMIHFKFSSCSLQATPMQLNIVPILSMYKRVEPTRQPRPHQHHRQALSRVVLARPGVAYVAINYSFV